LAQDFRRAVVPLALGLTLVTAACGHRNPPPVTEGPDHRIAWLIAQYHGVPSQEKYQAFIESEIGQNFTPEDFARYEENSGAVCQHDPQNGKTYCMWANFGWMAAPDPIEVAGIFCFWADPRLQPPRVRATRVNSIPLKEGDIRDSRTYLQSHPELTCRDQLRLFNKDNDRLTD